MNEHKAVPNIRFKDFEDEWAEKKISNFIIKNSDKNKNLAIKNIESISNKTGFTRQSEQFDGYRVASQDISNYYVISPNQFAYNPSRINVGSIAYKNKGEDKSIISPLYISFSTSSHINDHFLWFWFKTTSFKKQRIQFSEGGVRDTLPFENLKKMEISFPLLQEQQKIGNLFAKLDKLLDLQQQKIDKLELLKKALLQKLFPKHDADIPELRFKGFNDEWKSYLLGKIAVFINGRAFKQNELLDKGKYPVLRVGNFYTNDKWFYSDLELPEKLYANKGDLLYTWSATFGPHIWKGDKVIYHYHIWKIIFSSEVSKQFALQMLLNDKEELMNNTNGSTMIHLTKNEMEKKVVKIPIKPEQQKIGNLLSKVDQLIELENRKLQNFQQVKKCLLQNMFVD